MKKIGYLIIILKYIFFEGYAIEIFLITYYSKYMHLVTMVSSMIYSCLKVVLNFFIYLHIV
jgi:hypothetical protein